jgi:MoaA/NifB/PqqE/SkfB family radical SAM enzyme
MPFETYQSVVDTFRHAANISIVADGEPLLNSRFFDMVSYAKRVRRARVTTLSNGYFGRADIDRLLVCGLDLISISLKGHDSQDFARMTGLGGQVFDSIVNNVRVLAERAALLRRRPQIAVSFILDKVNYQHFGAMVERAESLGVDRVKFDPFIPLPLAGCRVAERCVTTADAEAIEVLSSHAGKHRGVAVRPPIVLDVDASGASCHSFFKVMRVDAAGYVSGCVVSHPELASDRDFSEVNVWNGRYFQEMRSRFLGQNYRDVPAACRECYQYCGCSLW